MSDATAIARACCNAFAAKDRAAIEAHRIDRQAYFARCWPNSEKIQRFDFIRVVEDGARVFVTYELRGTEGRRFRNTEVLTVRGDQIVEAEVYFGWSIPHEAEAGGFIKS